MGSRIPLLSDLREPPVVGRFYMVPVVPNFPWRNRVRDWPVLGPLHTDAEFFKFAVPHYHVDIRFVGERDFRFMAASQAWRAKSRDKPSAAAFAASVAPLNHRWRDLPKGLPPLLPRQCRRVSADTPILSHVPLIAGEMEMRYGSPAPAIVRRDGRLLCPHRKVDLSSFQPDADGIVTCPLHGLRVRCRAAESITA